VEASLLPAPVRAAQLHRAVPMGKVPAVVSKPRRDTRYTMISMLPSSGTSSSARAPACTRARPSRRTSPRRAAGAPTWRRARSTCHIRKAVLRWLRTEGGRHPEARPCVRQEPGVPSGPGVRELARVVVPRWAGEGETPVPDETRSREVGRGRCMPSEAGCAEPVTGLACR
jgi:hypothetical protein